MSSGAAPKDQTKDPLFRQLQTMLDIFYLVKRKSFLKRKDFLVALKFGEKCLTQEGKEKIVHHVDGKKHI